MSKQRADELIKKMKKIEEEARLETCDDIEYNVWLYINSYFDFKKEMEDMGYSLKYGELK